MKDRLHASALVGLTAIAAIFAAVAFVQVGVITGQYNEQAKKIDQLSSQLQQVSAQLSNLTRREIANRTIYVVLIPDVGGPGYPKFIPQEITILKGDKVTLVLNNTDDMDHGFIMDGYAIKKVIKAHETITVEFIADKAGVFEFNSPTHPQMTGQLIVLG